MENSLKDSEKQKKISLFSNFVKGNITTNEVSFQTNC